MADLEFTISELLWPSPSHRSMLYYLFLLQLESTGIPEEELPSNKERLKNLVSLQNDSFESVVSEYANLGIVQDEESCRLSQSAVFPLEKVFDSTFGTHQPDLLRYNGLRIAETSSESERTKLWVDKAINEIVEIFSIVPNMHFEPPKELDVRKTKKLLIQETGGDSPFVLWNFSSNPRMTRTSEIMELVEFENAYIKTRAYRKNRGDDGFTDNGLDSVAIVAAPTYDESVAHELKKKKKRLLGPINFEGILYYLDKKQLRPNGKSKKENEEIAQKNIDIRKNQYCVLIDALREHGGVVVSGIIDCVHLTKYLDKKLGDLYATHGIEES